MAREVDGEDAPVGREARRHREPVQVRTAQPVHEHDRRAGAWRRMAKQDRRSAPASTLTRASVRSQPHPSSGLTRTAATSATAPRKSSITPTNSVRLSTPCKGKTTRAMSGNAAAAQPRQALDGDVLVESDEVHVGDRRAQVVHGLSPQIAELRDELVGGQQPILAQLLAAGACASPPPPRRAPLAEAARRSSVGE